MVKIVALYRRPEDEAAFMRHYEDVHAPLARKYPGLRRLEVSRPARNLMGGNPPYYLIAEMYFDTMDDLKAALKSPEGARVGEDLMGFAAGRVDVLTAEVLSDDEPVPSGTDAHGLNG